MQDLKIDGAVPGREVLFLHGNAFIIPEFIIMRTPFEITHHKPRYKIHKSVT